MGSCLSKKSSSSSSSSSPAVATPPPDPDPISQSISDEQKKIPQAEENVKKEIFVIKQRKSHEKHPEDKVNSTTTTTTTTTTSTAAIKTNIVDSSSATVVNGGNISIVTAPIRTSSCTKEEVDAILIQCGRLSRSSSGKASAAAGASSGGHKYSGSKRSYDFDHDYYDGLADNKKSGDDDEEEDKYHHTRHQSRPSHRRTPSREKKDFEYKRSGSRDRSSSSREEDRKRNNGSRRSSRSPGRSEALSAAAGGPAPDKSKPGKMVSVPASVSTRDKSISAAAGGANVESATTTTGIKRVLVKRSGEVGLRTVASPRSRSPANARASNENANYQNPPQPVVSLSRNSSRKAEQSPYRRNPTNEIDESCVKIEQIPLKSQDHISSNKATGIDHKAQRIKEGVEGVTKKQFHLQSQKPDERKSKVVELPQGTTNNNSIQQENAMNCGKTKQQQIVREPIEAQGLPVKNGEVNVDPGTENLKPQTITRSRSSRRSRDLDLNLGFHPDTLLNPTSYASLLLEDIHNFHQQNTSGFSLPPCVTKACSILEAVADLNSCTSSNLSSAFSGDRRSQAGQSIKKNSNTVSSNAHVGKRRSDVKDPFVESEVFVSDDLLEPSLHKYVTLRRGDVMGGEMEQQESSGSNSFVGQHWVSSSSWEPNSADSMEHWTSRSNNGEEVLFDKEEPSLLGYQKQAFSEASACDAEVGARKLRSSGNSTALSSVPH